MWISGCSMGAAESTIKIMRFGALSKTFGSAGKTTREAFRETPGETVGHTLGRSVIMRAGANVKVGLSISMSRIVSMYWNMFVHWNVIVCVWVYVWAWELLIELKQASGLSLIQLQLCALIRGLSNWDCSGECQIECLRMTVSRSSGAWCFWIYLPLEA